MKKIFNLKALFLAAVILAVGVYMFGAPSEAHNIGQQAPPVVAADASGNSVAVNFEGTVTVLNFWATWCPPCRGEMPELQEFFQAHMGQVQFYAVNLQEPSGKVTQFMSEGNYTLPLLLDSGDVAKAYRISAIPTTVIVGSDGLVKFRKTGPVTKSELDQVIAGLR